MFARIAPRRRPASWSRRAARHVRQLTVESLEVRQMLAATPLTFQVVDDATANKSFHYSEVGAAQGSTSLVAANSAPRGVASTVAADQTWVIDANRNVYVYIASGGLLGSWSAGSMPNNATPQGIATDGTDVWIVDSRSDKVYRYAGAASRLAGSQAAASSFGGIGSNPKDIVTDGAHLWIVNDGSKSDQVYKFHVTNGYWGSWTIDKANKSPTGIALDPANVGDIWIADSGTDRVYKYAAATALTSGSQAAASSFALAAGNSNAQGLVIPGRPWAEAPYQVEWIRQFGTADFDWGRGVSVDPSDNIYVSGAYAAPQQNGGTSFVARFDDAGAMQWVTLANQAAGTYYEGVRVAADSLGNVFQVVGHGVDATGTVVTPSTLRNFGPDGDSRWTVDLPGEAIFNVAVDNAGYAYISTYEGNNVHVRKFEGTSGATLWHQIVDTGGTTNSSGISVDPSGNVYVAAYTSGSILGANAGSYDGVLLKFDNNGVQQWVRQFGTSGDDYAFQVVADQFGNVYTSGQTYGSLGGPNAGARDQFLTKHDANGNLLWTRQFGNSSDETTSASWVDPQGNLYRAMNALGALGGPARGDSDIVVVKYDPTGNILWATQLGTSGLEQAAGGITGDSQGNLYITGRTTGSFGGANAGGQDVVLIKLTPPPAAAVAAAASPEPLAALVALAPQKVADERVAKTPSVRNPAAQPSRDAAFAALPAVRDFTPPRRTDFTTRRQGELSANAARADDSFAGALDAALARLL